MLNLFGLDNVLADFAAQTAEEAAVPLTAKGIVFAPSWEKAWADLESARGSTGPFVAVAQRSNHWQALAWTKKPRGAYEEPDIELDSMDSPQFIQYRGHGWCQTFGVLMGLALLKNRKEVDPERRDRRIGRTLEAAFGLQVGEPGSPAAEKAQFDHNGRIAAGLWHKYLPKPGSGDGLHNWLLERLDKDCGIRAMITKIVRRETTVSVNSGSGGKKRGPLPEWPGWSAEDILARKARGDTVGTLARELAEDAYARIYQLLGEISQPGRGRADFGRSTCKPKDISSDERQAC